MIDNSQGNENSYGLDFGFRLSDFCHDCDISQLNNYLHNKDVIRIFTVHVEVSVPKMMSLESRRT